MIREIFLLRSIACFAVVLVHAISISFVDFGIREDPNYFLVNTSLFVIQILLLFCTPLFVFISEFVLANRYKQGAPNGFWLKRIKFIFVPYAVIGTAYSVYNSYSVGLATVGEYISAIIKMVFLGGYHGYFVLIIFQFYLLHFLFNRFIVDRFNTKKVIIASFLITFIYLIIFNFMLPVDANWYGLLILPFPGWLAYFTVAYYCGRNFEDFKRILNKYSKLIIVSPFVTGFIVIALCYTEILTPIQSKRVDMIFYTISVALFLFYVGSKIEKIPKLFMKISQYSFGIYLLHPVSQALVSRYLIKDYSLVNLTINILIYLVVGLVIPSIIVVLLNKTKFGCFIVGKIGISPKGKQTFQKSTYEANIQ